MQTMAMFSAEAAVGVIFFLKEKINPS